jgi:predicted RNase H-like HicB family nuclease
MEYFAHLTPEGSATTIEFPDAPGCQTLADRGEDLESLAREALEGCLEAHLVDGDAPPTRTKRRAKLPRTPQSSAFVSRLPSPWQSKSASGGWSSVSPSHSSGSCSESAGDRRQLSRAPSRTTASRRSNDSLKRCSSSSTSTW